MKVAWGILALAALVLDPVLAISGKGKPGYCNTDKDCEKTYTCVSVQTTRTGVTDVKQCLPTTVGMPVCTGIIPGLCPSFSTTWGKEFRAISSVCAYIQPEGNNLKCLDPNVTGNATTVKGAVQCLWVTDNDAGKEVGVIYGCVDFDGTRLLFKTNSKSDKLAKQFNYTQVIMENCRNPKNPTGASFVCSSQGTCAPEGGGQFDYSCKCNVGFSGKYCEKIENNKCYNDGVCGGGSCDLKTNLCSKCPAGTKGNKCAECDPSYDSTKVCNGQGKCVAGTGDSTLGAAGAKSSGSSNSSVSAGSSSAYQCECNDGYSGSTCDLKVAGKQPLSSSSDGSSATEPTTTAPNGASSTMTLSISAVVLTLALSFTA